MTLSNKADHKKLPKPTSGRLGTGKAVIAARTRTEEVLARALSEVLRLDEVSVVSHFFDDLGANSLDMARFCARLRKQPGFAGVAMRDIYMNPTLADLAEHVRHAEPEDEEALPPRPEIFHVPSDLSYWTCGGLQLLFYAAYGLAGLWAFQLGYEWIHAGLGSAVEVYLRAVAVGIASFFVASALPIALKWLLVGRWKAETFPIWSLRYFRFWAVQTLTRSAPVVLFAGSPMFSTYLRLLGAKIGRNTSIECRFVPVCTDLLSVGSNTVIRKETVVLGYRARGNMIETGPVTLGANAFVGEASVLDIDTAIGGGGQLGHGSSLHSGQRIPAGKRYHGSPAVETSANYSPLPNLPVSGLRRAAFDAAQILGLCAIAIPLPFLGFIYGEQLLAGSPGGTDSVALLLGGSLAGLVGAFAAMLLTAVAIPRLLRPLLQADRVYPLYGLHHWCQVMVDQFSNWRALNLLFGDSSAVVRYIRLIGWNLNKVEQTGSNFGTNQRHEHPLFCEIGSGTMVSDGLSMINTHKSASSFRLSQTRIGDNSYLGNNIHYPPDGRTGANVLLGTKVMIPIDGPVRENVGLLGSPSFEIPRMVDRDRALCTALPEPERLARLSRKNRHNLATAIMFLAAQWLLLLATIAIWRVALMSYGEAGLLAFYVASLASSAAAVVLACFIERASLGFGRLQPRMATIDEPYFWRHERHWKLADSPVLRLFPGTPFKNMISRLVGFEVGRKVYDGGSIVTERTLTSVGDYANLNEGSVLQAHSLEEGVFKSDYIRLAEGVTVGPNAFVHYGVQMERRSTLDADSFLMKGETVDAETTWRGNPARPRSRAAVDGHHAEGSTAGAKLFVPKVAAE